MEPQYRYVEIADDIQKQITDGKMPKGQKIPGELALAKEYETSAGTVRRAVQELRDRGLVATLQYKGTFVVG